MSAKPSPWPRPTASHLSVSIAIAGAQKIPTASPESTMNTRGHPAVPDPGKDEDCRGRRQAEPIGANRPRRSDQIPTPGPPGLAGGGEQERDRDAEGTPSRRVELEWAENEDESQGHGREGNEPHSGQDAARAKRRQQEAEWLGLVSDRAR